MIVPSSWYSVHSNNFQILPKKGEEIEVTKKLLHWDIYGLNFGLKNKQSAAASRYEFLRTFAEFKKMGC